jgi:hypothetical protein
MSTNPLRFTLSEEARLMKAIRLAGLTITRITRDERGRPVYITDQGEVTADANRQQGNKKGDWENI